MQHVVVLSWADRTNRFVSTSDGSGSGSGSDSDGSDGPEEPIDLNEATAALMRAEIMGDDVSWFKMPLLLLCIIITAMWTHPSIILQPQI